MGAGFWLPRFKNFGSPSCILEPVWGIWHAPSHLISPAGGHKHCAHFTDKATELWDFMWLARGQPACRCPRWDLSSGPGDCRACVWAPMWSSVLRPLLLYHSEVMGDLVESGIPSGQAPGSRSLNKGNPAQACQAKALHKVVCGTWMLPVALRGHMVCPRQLILFPWGHLAMPSDTSIVMTGTTSCPEKNVSGYTLTYVCCKSYWY